MADKAIRETFGANLKRLMAHAKNRWADHPQLGRLATALGLEQLTGVSDSAISRYKAGEVSAPIDHVEKIARAFGLQGWEMLYPNLDPASPPEVMSAERTKELQETLVAAAKLLGQPQQQEHETSTDGQDRSRATDRKMPSKSAQKHRNT